MAIAVKSATAMARVDAFGGPQGSLRAKFPLPSLKYTTL